jgi:hypothetical protein
VPVTIARHRQAPIFRGNTRLSPEFICRDQSSFIAGHRRRFVGKLVGLGGRIRYYNKTNGCPA